MYKNDFNFFYGRIAETMKEDILYDKNTAEPVAALLVHDEHDIHLKDKNFIDYIEKTIFTNQFNITLAMSKIYIENADQGYAMNVSRLKQFMYKNKEYKYKQINQILIIEDKEVLYSMPLSEVYEEFQIKNKEK